MSAQPAIVPTIRPRWTPRLVTDDAVGVGDPGDAGAGSDAGAVLGAPAVVTTDRRIAALRPASRASAWRRRAGAVAALVLLVFLLTVAIGRVTAGAELADPVAGTVTVAPGQTLWDVAAATAPAGVDAREQLAAIVELNGFDGSSVDAWTVVLLPAR